MKVLAIIATVLFLQNIPKHDPTGIWVSDSGSKYELRLSGSDLHVKLVPGSNAKFLQYEVEMKNESEINTYSGKGFLVAKMQTGKECKFPTEWRFIVVSPTQILGSSQSTIADGNTCEIQETEQIRLDMKKEK